MASNHDTVRSAIGTPEGFRNACKDALSAARQSQAGTTHAVSHSGVSYSADGMGGAVRHERTCDGGVISDRRIKKLSK